MNYYLFHSIGGATGANLCAKHDAKTITHQYVLLFNYFSTLCDHPFIALQLF